jgi:hypothetical protein
MKFEAPSTHLQQFIYPNGHAAPPLVLRSAQDRDIRTVRGYIVATLAFA